jgi:hypothetical protein
MMLQVRKPTVPLRTKALSVIGMGMASGGLLAPVAGAVAQEIIDVFAVLNALRAAMKPKQLSDLPGTAGSVVTNTGTLAESRAALERPTP